MICASSATRRPAARDSQDQVGSSRELLRGAVPNGTALSGIAWITAGGKDQTQRALNVRSYCFQSPEAGDSIAVAGVLGSPF